MTVDRLVHGSEFLKTLTPPTPPCQGGLRGSAHLSSPDKGRPGGGAFRFCPEPQDFLCANCL